jgi:hypothetical protein
MRSNRGLLVCESLMARLDVALDHASAEVQSTVAVEEQIRRLVAHLERAHQRLNELEAMACSPGREAAWHMFRSERRAVALPKGSYGFDSC